MGLNRIRKKKKKWEVDANPDFSLNPPMFVLYSIKFYLLNKSELCNFCGLLLIKLFKVSINLIIECWKLFVFFITN